MEVDIVMDYSVLISEVAQIVGVCFPVSLIFGLTAKLCNFALDMIFNKRITM